MTEEKSLVAAMTAEELVRRALRKQNPDEATVKAVARKIEKTMAFLHPKQKDTQHGAAR